MAEKLRAMMQKQQGGKSSFTMTGQYAGSVMREDGPMGSREFVMYDSPNGEQIKVYGNWNEYAAGRDEEGRDMIADEDYPIIQNEAGEFILDESRHSENMDTAYERQPVERMARETEMESTQGASKIENLLEKLQDARGPRPRFQEGGAMPDDKVVKMKKQIIRMMEGGASDKEIMMMINKSPLGKQYEFNWDNVEMKVEAYPMEDDRFGPKDKGGQRGDMFAYGGLMGKLKKHGKGGSMKYENGGKVSRLNSLLDASQGTISAGEGRRIEQDDFFNVRVDGEGFTYFIGDDGDDAYVKTPNGQYMRFQRDELIQAIGDQSDMLIRRQEGQRVGGVPMGGPFSGRYGGQGASKTEDLLERLRDVKRRR